MYTRDPDMSRPTEQAQIANSPTSIASSLSHRHGGSGGGSGGGSVSFSDFEGQVSEVRLGKRRADAYDGQTTKDALSTTADDEEDDDDDDEDDDKEDDLDEEDENASAFTDPSWYGSPFARYGSSCLSAWAAASGSPTDADNGIGAASSNAKIQSAPTNEMDPALMSKLSSYQKGIHLARRTLLHLDAQMDTELDDVAKTELLTSSSSLLPPVPPAKGHSRGKQRLIDDAAAQYQNGLGSAKQQQQQRGIACGTDILVSFDECPTYVCASCGTTLALQDELISKAFSGRDGKAYLFFSILNIRKGPKEDRQLLTGLHTVADLSCATCQRSVGWSYLRAFETSQKYKEGKFILERASLHKMNQWSDDIDAV